MSILIKGVKMPKEPWKCPCHDGETGWCKVTGHSCYDYIPKDCPLIEVATPHGELIDRDALIENLIPDPILEMGCPEPEYLFEFNELLMGADVIIKKELK